MSPILQVIGLVKQFPGGEGVDDISFHIDGGETVGFLGANGAGKTTTLRCLAGLYRPDQGNISVRGNNPGSVQAQYSTVFIPDNPFLYPLLTAGEHLQFRAKAFGISGKKVKETVLEVLQKVKLEEYIDRPTGNLSRGQKQRIILAGALIQNADLYLFDEPTVGLDIPSKQWLAQWVRQLGNEQKAVMISSHSLDFVSETADRVLLLRKGKLISEKIVPTNETELISWNKEVTTSLGGWNDND